MSIKLGRQEVSRDGKPLVVAEIGANHDGSVKKAEDMVRAIAEAGVKAIKFQFYTADELVADGGRIVEWGPPERRVKEPVGAMFDRLALSIEALRDLFALARDLGLEPFATPFSEKGVDRLMDLNISCFKIAASDVTHLPLLKYIAGMGKPVVLSLGKCTLSESDEAVECLLSGGCKDLVLLHCVATYPSPINEMNLRVIPALMHTYPECVVGFSDHSIGNIATVAAVALGARMIEKHVTWNKDASGPDHWFSLDMEELQNLLHAVKDVFEALGHPRKRVVASEMTGRARATRSLVATGNLPAGHVLRQEDIKVVRPGTGLSPTMSDTVQGMVLARPIRANDTLSWEHFRSPL